eukprot:232651_1
MGNKPTVYVVGKNEYYEFGMKTTNERQITNWTKKFPNKITNIISGDACCIYCDDINKIYWSAGREMKKWYDENTMDYPILHKCNYFNENNINIIKTCLSSFSSTFFWIDNKGNLYGNGMNNHCQLGIINKVNKSKSRYVKFENPLIIESLHNVIDVAVAHKYAKTFSVAICSSQNITHFMLMNLIKKWTNYNITLVIPQEVIRLILKYYQFNQVYRTKSGQIGWFKLNIGNQTPIIQLSAGSYYCMLLEENGVLWGFGDNNYGQIGLNHNKFVENPTKIQYFIDNKINIKQVKCGEYHTLALDDGGNVYAFGQKHACGYDEYASVTAYNEKEGVFPPMLVQSLQNYKLIKIDCSENNSYCLTSNGQHFVFGCNHYNQCLTFDHDPYYKYRVMRYLPHNINNIVKEKFAKKK